MSEVLNVPRSFFLRPYQEEHLGTVFFRSLQSATNTARTKAQTRLKWLSRVTDFVADYIELPAVNLPDFHFPSDPSWISDEDVVNAATKTRRYWGLKDGPISDVALLLENNGVVIVREPFLDQRIDAHSAWIAGVPYIILSADKESAVRSRLDLGHELGHLVVHRNVDSVRLEKQRADHELAEGQAYLFARHFLMPSSTFMDDVVVPTLDGLLAIKPKWKISVAAMLMHVKYLGLVSEEESNRLFALCGRRGWRKKEPLDDEIVPESPRLLRKAFELALREGVFTADDVKSELDLNGREVELFAGLDPGTLEPLMPELRIIGSDNPSCDDKPSNVLQFDREHRTDRI